MNGDSFKSLFERIFSKEENIERIIEKNFEKKRKREFKGYWKEMYFWFEYDVFNDVMYCMVCWKYLKLVDIISFFYRGIGGIGKYRFEILKFYNGLVNYFKCVNRS